MKKMYAVYRGDKFIDLGTKEELATKLNVKPETISFFSRPSYKKRIKGYENTLIVIRIEEDRNG